MDKSMNTFYMLVLITSLNYITTVSSSSVASSVFSSRNQKNNQNSNQNQNQNPNSNINDDLYEMTLGNMSDSYVNIPDEQLLIARLLRNYDPAARPVYNASKSVVIKFSFSLIQICDMVIDFFNYLLIIV
jgi:hypothetical protein